MPKRIEVVRDWCWEQVCDEVVLVIRYKAGTLVQLESLCRELARGILQTDIGPEAKLGGKWKNCYDKRHSSCTHCREAFANCESCILQKEYNEMYVGAEDQALLTNTHDDNTQRKRLGKKV